MYRYMYALWTKSLTSLPTSSISIKLYFVDKIIVCITLNCMQISRCLCFQYLMCCTHPEDELVCDSESSIKFSRQAVNFFLN